MIVVPPSLFTSMPWMTLVKAAASFKLSTCTTCGSVPGGPWIIIWCIPGDMVIVSNPSPFSTYNKDSIFICIKLFRFTIILKHSNREIQMVTGCSYSLKAHANEKQIKTKKKNTTKYGKKHKFIHFGLKRKTKQNKCFNLTK